MDVLAALDALQTETLNQGNFRASEKSMLADEERLIPMELFGQRQDYLAFRLQLLSWWCWR